MTPLTFDPSVDPRGPRPPEPVIDYDEVLKQQSDAIKASITDAEQVFARLAGDTRGLSRGVLSERIAQRNR